MKEVLIFLLGVFFGVIGYCSYTFKIALTDVISIVSLFVNGILGYIIATTLQNRTTSGRYAKEYFISQLENIRNEYDFLIKQLRDNDLNRQEINKEFKYFTIKITDIEYFLSSNLKLNPIEIQIKNRIIHQLITNSNEYNRTATNSKVKLQTATLVTLMVNHKDFNHHLTELVILINSK